MNIIKLVVNNIGGVEAFELDAQGRHVVIGGPNAAGKSTILRAIAGALGGAKERGAMPLRAGATDGEVVVDLGDLVVRWRTNDRGNDYLTVENADGARYKSPTKMLEKLFGARTFDPLAFVDLPPREQARAIADLVGVDLDALDAKRAEIYEARTDANRSVKSYETMAAGYVVPDGTPEEPVDVGAIVAKLRDAERENAKLVELEAKAERLRIEEQRAADALEAEKGEADNRIEAGANSDRIAIVSLERQITGLQAELAEAQKCRHTASAKAVAQRAVEAATERCNAAMLARGRAEVDLEGMSTVDTTDLERSLAEADETNKAVEIRRQRTKAEELAAEIRAEAEALTARIAEIDEEKRAAIAAAKLPIEGLSIDDGVVTWQGRPLSVLSSSEQLRVSVALGIAAHPDIAVMLPDRWGDLDDERRALVREMADEAGVQIITTVVGEKDEDITVVIREGRVAVAPGQTPSLFDDGEVA